MHGAISQLVADSRDPSHRFGAPVTETRLCGVGLTSSPQGLVINDLRVPTRNLN